MVGIDPMTITLMGGIIVNIIAAIGAVIVGVYTSQRLSIVEQIARDTGAIRDIAKDAEAIKGHVNSEKTAAEGREMTLRRENDLLKEMVADKKTTAGLLAQAVATQGAAMVKIANGNGNNRNSHAETAAKPKP